jgi:hypothetical protein
VPVIAKSAFFTRVDHARILNAWLSGMLAEAVHARQVIGDDSDCAHQLGRAVEPPLRRSDAITETSLSLLCYRSLGLERVQLVHLLSEPLIDDGEARERDHKDVDIQATFD